MWQLRARGLILMKRHDSARALEAFDRTIALDPRSIETYYLRGGLHQDQGKHDLAIADFRKAIELQPKTFFDMAAQVDAKKRVEALGNQLPCRGAGNAAGQTCL
jgi:tetratricopeptide (TPR) repeat protein